MKESEAKEKWCPMVRMGAHENNGFNRDSQSGAEHLHYKCIGSACMMWEDYTWPEYWNDPVTGQPFEFAAPPTEKNIGVFDGCLTLHEALRSGRYKVVEWGGGYALKRASDEREGDCGLKTKDPEMCCYPG